MNLRLLALIGLALAGCHSSEPDKHTTAPAHSSTAAPAAKSGQSSSAQAASAPATKSQTDAAHFVQQAAQGGRFEVDSSNLVLLKGVTGKMKDFAQMMLDDHGKANAELEKLAKAKGLSMPSALDTQHQAKLDELSKLDGAELESAYRSAQIQAHDDALRLFQDASEHCSDKELREFAKSTLPTLQKHRDHLNAAL